MATPIQLTDQEFRRIGELVYDHFGITLNESKRSLVVNRLNKLLREKGFESFTEYNDLLTSDKTGVELQVLANSISTNHTFFNRESLHFDFLTKTALPDVCKNIKDKDLRVWCAAASTGEEPYTLAMLIREYLGTDYRSWKAGLLATDISEKALNTARIACYPESAVNKLPATLSRKYFTQTEQGCFVNQDVKDDVTYRKLNLVKKFCFRKPLHIVFCRNVMIYFDQPTKDKLIRQIYDWMVPGGYFFVGHSETIPRDNCPFKYIMPAVYRKEN